MEEICEIFNGLGFPRFTFLPEKKKYTGPYLALEFSPSGMTSFPLIFIVHILSTGKPS